ncbi:hypothetical protein A8D95_12525 [Burkholderia cenocepacia]|uniref:Uncharacterized protein n=1 Tax=Burkholderia cenocepacia TaxID=95486 RepID=A0A1V2W7J7_9BURK|nr:hypothetical protein A8D83_00360 [Burkholderia cenocepacia]ONJ28347.1 hypothetical protein A8D90_17895 [Burkholderia cenocepacia]ONP30784.1 hypothetical protein A8D86_31265 [Burkholderia cenocepacia]ONP32827.1 hypothetical protein A8D84_08180 [Burkholderia cenocepacia]ONP36172.1 hypothetical protein A8D85_22285 [Burkholderia cenocepacia]
MTPVVRAGTGNSGVDRGGLEVVDVGATRRGLSCGNPSDLDYLPDRADSGRTSGDSRQPLLNCRR